MRVTEHFDSDEMACRDGTPYPLQQVDELDAEGRTWRVTRLEPLFDTLEIIRAAAGAGAITIDSGFRTLAYDQLLYERSKKDGDVAPATSSQHPKGRAADIVHARLSPKQLHGLIMKLWDSDKLPLLGGLGLYATFVHVDVRLRPPGDPEHLAQWTGGRKSNVA